MTSQVVQLAYTASPDTSLTRHGGTATRRLHFKGSKIRLFTCVVNLFCESFSLKKQREMRKFNALWLIAFDEERKHS